MKIEVINDHSDLNKETDVYYWLSTVIDVDNNMMLLRYSTYTDDSNDFWIDVRSKHIHPVGWCYKHRKPLVPPSGKRLMEDSWVYKHFLYSYYFNEKWYFIDIIITFFSFIDIKTKENDWQRCIFDELSGSRTISADFMDRVQKGHYNKFECGSKVEVSDKRQNLSMCVATIVKIVGDRLGLRYDGLDNNLDIGLDVDHWVHFLSSNIHPVGWSQLVGLKLSPPFGNLSSQLYHCLFPLYYESNVCL